MTRQTKDPNAGPDGYQLTEEWLDLREWIRGMVKDLDQWGDLLRTIGNPPDGMAVTVLVSALDNAGGHFYFLSEQLENWLIDADKVFFGGVSVPDTSVTPPVNRREERDPDG